MFFFFLNQRFFSVNCSSFTPETSIGSTACLHDDTVRHQKPMPDDMVINNQQQRKIQNTTINQMVTEGGVGGVIGVVR